MDDHRVKAFVATFAIAAAVALGGWFAIDVLANLDEFLGVAGPGADVVRVAWRHYPGVLDVRGGAILAAIAAGAATVAALRARRAVAPRSGS